MLQKCFVDIFQLLLKQNQLQLKTIPHFVLSQLVEILVFAVRIKVPSFLREAQNIDGTMLISFLNRRNSEHS